MTMWLLSSAVNRHQQSQSWWRCTYQTPTKPVILMSYTERHQIQPHSSYILRSHRSPHSFFTPTNLSFADSQTGAKAGDWSSRRARKGRYAPKQANIHYVRHGKPEEEKGQVEDGKSKEKKETVERMEQMAVARIRKTGDIRLGPIFKMDVSFWVAVTFTLGSVVWVINGMSLQLVSSEKLTPRRIPRVVPIT